MLVLSFVNQKWEGVKEVPFCDVLIYSKIQIHYNCIYVLNNYV